jgi:hypothetical protein
MRLALSAKPQFSAQLQEAKARRKELDRKLLERKHAELTEELQKTDPEADRLAEQLN